MSALTEICYYVDEITALVLTNFTFFTEYSELEGAYKDC